MAEAALALSIKFVQTPSDTFCLSSLPAAGRHCSLQRFREQQNQHIQYSAALSHQHTYYRLQRSFKVLWIFLNQE